jgi:hypothetical protein
MMLANEMVPIPMTVHGVPDYAWLAGAKAGLVQRGHETPDWPWLHFLDGVQTMVGALQGLKPLEPGDEPEDGSVYDSLGGYVSVTGHRTDVGLIFPVSRRRAAVLASMLPGIDMVWAAGHLVVQGASVGAFERLVPLSGPIVKEVVW